MTDQPKILWHSNAPWSSTGYGQQTSLVTPLLNRTHDVAISGFYGLEGNRLSFNDDIVVFPGMGSSFGNEIIQSHARTHFDGDLRGGLVATLLDVWVLDPAVWRKLNVASWVPVDHDPAPPMVRQFFTATGAVPIAMSKFGRDKLSEFDPLYVPHAVDTSVYAPHPRDEVRDQLNLPRDAFVVGMVAANKGRPSRKCIPEVLMAFKELRRRHSDALLYLHTEIEGRAGEGVQLGPLVSALGLPEGSVIYADQDRYMFNPYSPEVMARIYSSFDVLVNPSRGEGFGIPILEAQACGTPVIVTDFSAMRELCGSGWLVEFEREWTFQNSWQGRPKVGDIAQALRSAYSQSEGARQKLSEKAVEFAADYEVEKVVAENFLPALEEVQTRIEARAPVTVAA